jgi:hypothetical protein
MWSARLEYECISVTVRAGLCVHMLQRMMVHGSSLLATVGVSAALYCYCGMVSSLWAVHSSAIDDDL